MSKPTLNLVNFADVMREVYGVDGRPTEAGKQILSDLEAKRAERNKPVATLIDAKGQLTEAGRDRLDELADVVRKLLWFGHSDNTGTECRVDLDGHDCCYVCNQAEDMLRATAKYYEESE